MQVVIPSTQTTVFNRSGRWTSLHKIEMILKLWDTVESNLTKKYKTIVRKIKASSGDVNCGPLRKNPLPEDSVSKYWVLLGVTPLRSFCGPQASGSWAALATDYKTSLQAPPLHWSLGTWLVSGSTACVEPHPGNGINLVCLRGPLHSAALLSLWARNPCAW